MSNKKNKRNVTVSYSRNAQSASKKAANKNLMSIVYLVYYSAAGIITSLIFSLLRLQTYGGLLIQAGIALTLFAVVSVLPVVLMIKTKAAVSMYIITPICTLSVVALSLTGVFSMGLIIAGLLLGVLLALINQDFSMKGQTLILIVFAVCAVVTAGYAVYSPIAFVKSDGLYYRLEGNGYTLVDAVPDEDNQVIVPKEIMGRDVKKVSPNAFQRRGVDIWNVNIPSGISVPKGALSPCVNLLAVSLDFTEHSIYYFFGEEIPMDGDELLFTSVPLSLRGVRAYGKRICEYAFIFGSVYELTVSDEVEEIGEGAFADNFILAKVNLGKNVIYIAPYAFSRCNSLYSVNLKDTKVEFIAEYAFTGCSTMLIPVFPDTLKRIGSYAFSYCKEFGVSSYMTKLVIPSSVQIMGSYVFFESTKAGIAGWDELFIKADWPYAPESWSNEWDVLLVDGEGEPAMYVNVDYGTITE